MRVDQTRLLVPAEIQSADPSPVAEATGQQMILITMPSIFQQTYFARTYRLVLALLLLVLVCITIII